MDRSKKIILLLLGVIWGMIWVSKVAALPIFPPLMLGLSAILIGVMVKEFAVHKEKHLLWPIGAYFFVIAGDYFLNYTPFAKLHIASFAVVLIILITGFFKEVPFKKDSLKFVIPPSVLSLILYGAVVVPALPHPLAIPFFIYVTLLTLLVWRSFCYTKEPGISGKGAWLLFVGAVLFYITDVLVGIRIIYRPENINTMIYILYPPSLILIAISNWFRK